MTINIIANSDLGKKSELRFESGFVSSNNFIYNHLPDASFQNIHRIYFDYGLNVDLPNKLSESDVIYLVIGDSHHLPGLLLLLKSFLVNNCQNIDSIFFYGKPSHFRFFYFLGLNCVRPAPIDWYYLEAQSQISLVNNIISPKPINFSICRPADNYHQFRRRIEVSNINDDRVLVHNFMPKQNYLSHLSRVQNYIVVSNCLQFNPQWFFCLMTGAIPFVNGICHSYFALYPDLLELPIVDYSLFGLKAFMHEPIKTEFRRSFINSKLCDSSDHNGEIYCVLDQAQRQISSHDIQSISVLTGDNLEIYKNYTVQYLAIYEVCQQLIKFSSHYFYFYLLSHDHNFNKFMFDDLHIATENYSAKLLISHQIYSGLLQMSLKAYPMNSAVDKFLLDESSFRKAIHTITTSLRERFSISMDIDYSSILSLS